MEQKSLQMDKAELEKLIAVVTREVVRALEKAAPGPSSCSGNCDCRNEKTEPAAPEISEFRFEGRVLVEAVISEACSTGACRILVKPRTIVTPLARDEARKEGIEIKECEEVFAAGGTPGPQQNKSLVLFASHCGRSEENAVVEAARSAGYSVLLEGTGARTTSAKIEGVVASARRMGEGGLPNRMIVIDELVYPLANQLGKISGARPAICWDSESAGASRRDLDSNVLLMNHRMVGLPAIGKIVRTWLTY